VDHQAATEEDLLRMDSNKDHQVDSAVQVTVVVVVEVDTNAISTHHQEAEAEVDLEEDTKIATVSECATELVISR
jgi:hypothetical protein